MSDNGREGFDFKCGEKAMGCSQLSAQVNNERRYASAQDGKGNDLLQPLLGGQMGGATGRRQALLGIKVSHLTLLLAPHPS